MIRVTFESMIVQARSSLCTWRDMETFEEMWRWPLTLLPPRFRDMQLCVTRFVSGAASSVTEGAGHIRGHGNISHLTDHDDHKDHGQQNQRNFKSHRLFVRLDIFEGYGAGFIAHSCIVTKQANFVRYRTVCTKKADLKRPPASNPHQSHTYAWRN